MQDLIASHVDDSIAYGILFVLLLIQLLCWRSWRKHTRLALRTQQANLQNTIPRLESVADPTALITSSTAVELRQALHAAYPPGEHDEAVELRVAFDSESLLPRIYHGRLDTAAPGVFTAIGIIGTFIGLVVAFFRLDPTEAVDSIPSLIAGMKIAFVNSLVGVSASILWTLRSRFARHDFDVAAHELLAAFEKRFPRRAHGTSVLTALVALRTDVAEMAGTLKHAIEGVGRETRELATIQGEAAQRLQAGLGDLKSATEGASRSLLESLAPKLQETFRSLVDLPFEQLGSSVKEFDRIVATTAERNARSLEQFDRSITSLAVAHNELERATGSAAAYATTFAAGVDALQKGADSASAVLQRTELAAERLQGASDSFVAASQRHEETAHNVKTVLDEVQAIAAALDRAAQGFESGANQLTVAAAEIGGLGREAADLAIGALRTDLARTVESMAASLREFGDRNVEAYDRTSARIVESLDSRVSDLTDRLSAELSDLANRLPDSAAQITGAVAQMRGQLDRSIRSLTDATTKLDTSSTQSLSARLEQYDRLVADAVDRFSGTLLSWDGRLAELAGAGKALHAGSSTTLDALSRASADVQQTLTEAARHAREAARVAREVRQSAEVALGALTMPSTALPPTDSGAMVEPST